MTDAELINLLETQPPTEWTEVDLTLLRERIRDSAEVRQAVAAAIRLDQALAETFGEVHLSVDAILSAADQPKRHSGRWWAWGLGTALVLIGAAVLFVIQRANSPNVDEQASPVVASPQDTPPAPATEVAAATQPQNPLAKGTSADDVTGDRPSATNPEAGDHTPAAAPDKAVATATPPSNPTGPVKPAASPIASAGAGTPVTAPTAVPSVFPELSAEAAVLPVGGIDLEPSGLAKVDLQRWLEGVPGEPHQFNETQRHDARVASFDGVVRLKPTWTTDSVLRMATFDNHGLTIYFWTGDTGVAFVHYQPRGRMEWAAYVVTRRPGERRPSSWTLASTDGGLYERLSRPPLDIRHQDGKIVVYRGRMRLLAAPLATTPTEVYFERKGATWLRAFRMYRGEEFPAPSAPERNVLAELGRPVDLEWTTRLPENAYWYPSLEGPVELKTEKSNQLARADFALPATGLMEYLVEVSGATPGSGVFLGNDLGEPVAQLGFFDCQQSQETAYGFLPVGGVIDHVSYNPQQQISPYVAPRQWFRMVVGCGVFQAWSSLDGLSWTRIPDAPQAVPHGKRTTRLGIYCLPGAKSRRITLHGVVVREFTPLTRLVAREVLDTVPDRVIDQRDEYGAWLEAVLGAQPVGVALDDWLRTAALATLIRGPRTGPVGNDVLHGLLVDAIDRLDPNDPERNVQNRLDLLAAGAELINGWNYQYAIRHALLYERLGQVLIRQGHARPWSTVGAALLTTPLWTETVFDAMPATLVRSELIRQVYRDEWEGALATAQQVEYWNESGPPEYRWEHHRPGFRPLVAWCLAAAAREIPDRPRARGTPPFPALWRHPLVQDVSKEGFNMLAEMRVALSEKSFTDACRIITNARPDEALGLVPDSRESRLLVSLPQSVAIAMRDEPELARVMREEFGKLGGLRVQQAMRDGNEVSVRGTTVQFHGTDAARQARVWLGDRELAEGDFAGAIREYQAGLEQADLAAAGGPTSDSQSRLELAQRLRFASAFLGRDVGEAAREAVAFGPRSIIPDEFERMVTEVREATRNAADTRIIESDPPILSAAPAAGEFEVQPRGPWQGEFGHGAGNPNHGLIDWTARQLAVVPAGDVLIAANRFQVVAFDAKDGKVRWSRGLGGEIGHAHRFPMVPMRPVVAGDRLYVRRLTKEGPQLACLKVADGDVVWQARPGDVLSDPIIVQGRLLALVASPTSDGTQQIGLAEFQPSTGVARAGEPLLRFHDVWDKQVPSAITLAGHRIVGFAGGTTFACDLAGKALWLRKATWLPPIQDGSHYEIQVLPPLVANDRMYVLQANARAVDCLETATGRKLWTRGIVDPRRMIGLSHGKVLLEADNSWVALDAQTGDVAWRNSSGPWLDACFVESDQAAQGRTPRMIVCRREMVLQDQWRPELVWIDVANGRETGTAPLVSLTDRDPQLGPLVVAGDRLWSFSGKGQRDPKREVVELVSRASLAEPAALELASLASWRHVTCDPRLQWGLQATIPGWTCLRGGHDPRCGYRPEHLGRKGVLGMIASDAVPTVFAAEWKLSPEGTAPLRLRVGQDGQEAWRLRVLVAGNCVADELIAPSTTSGGWRDISVSLPAPVLATFSRDENGLRIVPVVVEGRPEARGKPVATYWTTPN